MTSANASGDLIWNVIRGYNSKQISRKNGFVTTTLSKEKGNLTNQNSRRFSALANGLTVHVKKTQTGFEVQQRRRRAVNRPRSSLNSSKQKNPNRKQKIGNAIANLLGTRTSLKTAARRRWERVYRINRRNTRRLAQKAKANTGKSKENKPKNVNDVN